MAQRNRRRARNTGSGTRATGAGNGAAPKLNRVGPDEHIPASLDSGEEQLTEAQLALGRPELAERPDPEELTAFEEADAGRAPAPAGLPADGDEATPARSNGHAVAPRESDGQSLPARAVGFLRGSWAELQRVQWPDRRQVFQATGVVLGFVIVAGAFLGVASFAAEKIVNLILYGHG